MADVIADPETDPRATYAVDPARTRRLVRRVVAGPNAEHRVTRTPMTDAPLATLPISSPEDVAVAVETARAAQRSWASTPLQRRAAILLRFHDLVLDRQVELLDIVQLESGKARSHAFEEVADCAIVSRHYARSGARIPRRHPAPRGVPHPLPGRREPAPQGRRRHRQPVELPAQPVDHRRAAGAHGR